MELKDFEYYVNSENYRNRFFGEYWQTKIRYEKLKNFNNKIEAAILAETEEPKHDCPLALLKKQQSAMGEYLHILELRAEIENIDLNIRTGVIAYDGKTAEVKYDK